MFCISGNGSVLLVCVPMRRCSSPCGGVLDSQMWLAQQQKAAFSQNPQTREGHHRGAVVVDALWEVKQGVGTSGVRLR